jgi:hypothetical protein
MQPAELVELLMEARANTDQDGLTPLSWVAYCGLAEAVDFSGITTSFFRSPLRQYSFVKHE